MWPGQQRLRKEVVARPVVLNARGKNGPVSWSPTTQLNMLIEKRNWNFLAAKRSGSLTDHSKLWTKGEQIKATNLSNFV
jgi:hypothetical protein